MDGSDCRDYEQLQVALLLKSELTPEADRTRLQGIQKNKGMTSMEVVSQLGDYLHKWGKGKGVSPLAEPSHP